MSIDEYKLSCELIGHSLDVRAVTEGAGCIISGSRDKTTKYWTPENNNYVENLTLRDHTNFIAAVITINDGKWVCTSSNDSTICVYEFNNTSPFAVLKGHTSTVCTMAEGLKPQEIISGSWDKSVRIWSNIDSTYRSVELNGHEAAVWAVVTLASGKYATGSADKNIFIWNSEGSKILVLKGHTDCVRGLVALPDGSLLSCSNDATIRYWNAKWECVREFHGHSNYIYCIALNKFLGDDVFVTGSEDSSIRMWSISKGALGNALSVPTQSVWAITCLQNGDIVTGTSDAMVRVFTKEESRFAASDVQAAFNMAVQTRNLESSKELGGIKVNELPGPESLLQEGTEGQTKMVRQPDGKILCYQWANGLWNCLGDVMGASGGSQQSSGKTLHEGKEYDYVFSVDITEGAPPIKLPYNRGEDPWLVAQKFIHLHNLPQVYLDEVANFIIKNSDSTPIVSAASGFADPFTGEGRYVPGSGNNFQTEFGSNTDPFTGESSYSSNQGSSSAANLLPQVNNTSGMNLDPLTGGSSYSTSSNGVAVQHFPFSVYHTLESCDPAKVLDKLKDFNSKAGDGTSKVSDELLEGVIKFTVPSPQADSLYVDALKHLLTWPRPILFPVLDITRLAVREQNICRQLGTPEFLTLLVDNLTSIPANQLMSIRCFINMMGHEYGKRLVESKLEEIVTIIEGIKQGSANLQIAISTLYLNLTISQIEQATSESCRKITEGILDFLVWSTDVEALYRAFQALGNLSCTPNGQIVLAQIKSVDIVVEKINFFIKTEDLSSSEQKLKECAKSLYGLF